MVNRARAWILKNCRASVGPDAGVKSKFSVSNRAFAIAGKRTPCRIYLPSTEHAMEWNGKWDGMEGEFWHGIWKMLRMEWNGRFEKWNGRSSCILLYLPNSELRRVYQYAIRGNATHGKRQKFFAPYLFYFTVHRSREHLRNPSTFTYIIILVACRVSVNAPLLILKLITNHI